MEITKLREKRETAVQAAADNRQVLAAFGPAI